MTPGGVRYGFVPPCHNRCHKRAPAGPRKPPGEGRQNMVEDTRGSEPDGDGLWRCGANRAPLNPVSLLLRTAQTYPGKTAVVHGDRRYTYAQFHDRCVALAAALAARGSAPATGWRSSLPTCRPCSKPISACSWWGPSSTPSTPGSTARRRLLPGPRRRPPAPGRYRTGGHRPAGRGQPGSAIPIVDIADLPEFPGWAKSNTKISSPPAPPISSPYSRGRMAFGVAHSTPRAPPATPKGVVYHARAPTSTPCPTPSCRAEQPHGLSLDLPLFHCNGWTYPWAVTAVGGTHVCLRRVEAGAVFGFDRARGSPRCTAPPSSSTSSSMPGRKSKTAAAARRYRCRRGGAALHRDRQDGGPGLSRHPPLRHHRIPPASICAWQEGWKTFRRKPGRPHGPPGRAHAGPRGAHRRRPGYAAAGAPDSVTWARVLLRGNAVMKAISERRRHRRGAGRRLLPPRATSPSGTPTAISRSGPLRDIIISGGENISSWGRGSPTAIRPSWKLPWWRRPATPSGARCPAPSSPCGRGGGVGADEIIAFCRERLAHFKCPAASSSAPGQTATGKVQKFQLRDTARRQLATAGEKGIGRPGRPGKGLQTPRPAAVPAAGENRRYRRPI